MASGGIENCDLSEQIQESNNSNVNNAPEPYSYNSLMEQLEVIKKNNEKPPQKLMDTIQESHKKLEKMIKSKNEEIFKLSNETYRMKQEINFLSKKNESYSKKVNQLEQEIVLHTKSSKLQIDHNLKLEEQLTELEEENKKLKERNNPMHIVNGHGVPKPTIEQLILRMESTQHKLSNQLMQLVDKLSSSKSTNAFNAEDLTKLKNDIITKEKEITKSTKKLIKLEKEIEFNDKRLAELQSQLQKHELSEENNNTILKQISTIIEKNEENRTRKFSIEEYIQLERSKLPEFDHLKSVQEEALCMTKSKLEADLIFERELKSKINKIQGIVDFLKCENNTLSGSFLTDLSIQMGSVSLTESS